MKYEIKKARSRKGNIFWAIYQGRKFISAHGDRQGAQIAIRYLRGDDPHKIKFSIENDNLRWIKNLTDAMQ